MQFAAKDGSMHGSQLKAYQSSQSSAPPDDQSQGGDISSNPEAMQCVDKLKQMGYTADDVAKAMDSGADASGGQSSSGAAAAQAAPLQIPGMQ